MDNHLQKALSDILLEAANGAKAAKDFLSKETPDIVRQAIYWAKIEGLLKFLFGCLSLLIAIIGSSLYWPWFINRFDNLSEGSQVVGTFLGLLVVIVLFIIGFINTFDTEWLKPWIVPKVWLIEYTDKLIRK